MHEIITNRVKCVDVHDVDVSQVSAHSLRIGVAGSIAINGMTDREILGAVGLRTFDGSNATSMHTRASPSRYDFRDKVRTL